MNENWVLLFKPTIIKTEFHEISEHFREKEEKNRENWQFFVKSFTTF